MSSLLHLNLSDSHHPKLETCYSKRDTFLLGPRNATFPEPPHPSPSGFWLNIGASGPEPHVMASPGLSILTATFAFAFQNNPKMGPNGFRPHLWSWCGVWEGHWRTPPLFVSLMTLWRVCPIWGLFVLWQPNPSVFLVRLHVRSQTIGCFINRRCKVCLIFLNGCFFRCPFTAPGTSVAQGTVL